MFVLINMASALSKFHLYVKSVFTFKENIILSPKNNFIFNFLYVATKCKINSTFLKRS